VNMFWDRFEWDAPWFLALLLLLPFLAYRLLKKSAKSPNALYFSDVSHIPKISNWKIKLHHYLPFLRLLVIALFILAIARPRWLLKEEKIDAEGVAIFLVMDLSSSMLSQDFQPNRLEVSKLVAVDFISKRPYDRIGLTAFSGEAFTQCPLTTDHEALKALLQELKCGLLEDGTAIGMGLTSIA
jgi:Ca-activated chloride channel homolog